MSGQTDAIQRFEEHLRRALDAFADNLRQHLEAGIAAGGAPVEPLDVICGWQAEEARLRRNARRNAPGYALDRQAALRALLALGTIRSNPATD